MTFNEHSPLVLDKIHQLYHQAVSGPLSTALLEAVRFGYELGRLHADCEKLEAARKQE